MKANELRIGNLVTTEWYPDFDKDGIKVESINDKGINLSIEDDGRYPEIADRWIQPYYDFDELYPIPLTEEWLLKSGCDKKKDSLEIDRFRLRWLTPYKYWYVTDNITNSYFTKIEFVHEWQNFYFILQGEELIITLRRV